MTEQKIKQFNQFVERTIREDGTSKIAVQGNKMTTQLISAFPGVGKTHLYNYLTQTNPNQTAIKDTDSSQFDKKDFPNNYIKSIQQDMSNYKLILVSSHIQVRQQLQAQQIPYYLVYPHKDLKQAYLERYKQRNSPTGFIQLLKENWDDWICSCEKDTYAQHKVLLAPDEYLSTHESNFFSAFYQD